MAEYNSREHALSLRRKIDALELEKLLRKEKLDRLEAENASLKQLRNFLEWQTEDAAFRVSSNCCPSHYVLSLILYSFSFYQ